MSRINVDTRRKKMRLIDADKLRHELIIGHDLIGAKYTDMADTVKAIPIEWLKRYEITKGQEVRLQDAINEWEKENETN